MTPYLQIVSRLLQSFWLISRGMDLVSLFDPITVTEITSQEEHCHESLTPVPVLIRLFSFKDTEERTAELELNFKKDTGELINARVQTFFTDTNKRDKYNNIYVETYFLQGFKQAYHPKYPDLPVKEYFGHGLAIGVNSKTDVPFISTYITLEGMH